MSDLIYRQADIDALMNVEPIAVIDEQKNIFPAERTEDAIKAISDLPSAQPEIIRCKDCKHKYIENMVWTCPFGIPGGELFFCAYGVERRTDE